MENFDIQQSSGALFAKNPKNSANVASKMCFMSPNFQVFLKSTVQNLILTESTRDDANDLFNVKLYFADINGDPLASFDTSQGLNILLTEFPTYLADQYMGTVNKADFYKKLLDFTTADPLTNANGIVTY